MSATTEVPATFHNAAGSRSPRKLVAEGIADIRSRRRLVRYLVQADLRKRGANTFLGNVWWVLDPMLQMAVYVVFLTIVGRNREPDFPLFIFVAVLPWKWFASSVQSATNSIVKNDQLIKQMQFPKLVLPVAATTSGAVSFVFGTVALGLVLVLFPHRVSAYVLYVPLIAIVQFTFTLACSLLVAAGNVFFRDLGNVVGHLLRLWWFLSPGLYSLATLDELSVFRENPALTTLASANPFAVLFSAYRTVIYGTREGTHTPPDFVALGILFVASLAFLALTTYVFKRLEPNFAKIV